MCICVHLSVWFLGSFSAGEAIVAVDNLLIAHWWHSGGSGFGLRVVLYFFGLWRLKKLSYAVCLIDCAAALYSKRVAVQLSAMCTAQQHLQLHLLQVVWRAKIDCSTTVNWPSISLLAHWSKNAILNLNLFRGTSSDSCCLHLVILHRWPFAVLFYSFSSLVIDSFKWSSSTAVIQLLF